MVRYSTAIVPVLTVFTYILVDVIIAKLDDVDDFFV